MRRLIIATLITFFVTSEVQAKHLPQTPQQTTPDKSKPALDPEKLVEEWMKRLNALDSWHLTVDGKEEGVQEVVDSMMELYSPDVLAEVPPHDDDQIGSVMLRGTALLRQWVDKIARTQVRLNYIRVAQTRKEFNGEQLLFTTPLPWGGVGVSFQIIGAWSMREDRLNKRFMAPGAVFLQFGDDGKIQRLRLYLTEITRVVAG
jgi:hypothetical protein